ncbi:MAG: response regulator, partial [Nitrospinaceae bacterium]|nr:response regulator [Nitrospinaceae bacterium]MBT5947649.1 response regulator [Nitrospinaceae bacterium]
MKRILAVDDEAPNREYLSHMLDSLGYEAETAQDGIEALAKLNLGFDLVLVDLMMPGMDGFEVVEAIRQTPEMHDIPIVIITGMENKENRIRSVEAGANDFISKPIDLTELEVRLRSLLKMKEAQDAIKEHRASLEKTVNQRTNALRSALEEMAEAKRMSQTANIETIDCLALASDYKDEDTGSHVRRLSHYCSLIATDLKLSPHQIETIFRASP